jgi:hypothetical protein
VSREYSTRGAAGLSQSSRAAGICPLDKSPRERHARKTRVQLQVGPGNALGHLEWMAPLPASLAPGDVDGVAAVLAGTGCGQDDRLPAEVDGRQSRHRVLNCLPGIDLLRAGRSLVGPRPGPARVVTSSLGRNRKLDSEIAGRYSPIWSLEASARLAPRS